MTKKVCQKLNCSYFWLGDLFKVALSFLFVGTFPLISETTERCAICSIVERI